jgi:hypothetical protein
MFMVNRGDMRNMCETCVRGTHTHRGRDSRTQQAFTHPPTHTLTQAFSCDIDPCTLLSLLDPCPPEQALAPDSPRPTRIASAFSSRSPDCRSALTALPTCRRLQLCVRFDLHAVHLLDRGKSELLACIAESQPVCQYVDAQGVQNTSPQGRMNE